MKVADPVPVPEARDLAAPGVELVDLAVPVALVAQFLCRRSNLPNWVSAQRHPHLGICHLCDQNRSMHTGQHHYQHHYQHQWCW